jgi:hypothetical protein
MFGWLWGPGAEAKAAERERLVAHVRKKLPELRKLKRKAIDRWGVFIPEWWEYAKENFARGSLEHELTDIRGHGWQDLAAIVDEVMEAREVRDLPVSGHDYEAIVAAELRGLGWEVEPTAGSGDHGVDLVAGKGTLRVAVQCKRFKGRVGTAAVQAVVGGAAYYQANRTAVVTTGNFTAAAHELAAANGTVLLEHADLPEFDRLLAARWGPWRTT